VIFYVFSRPRCDSWPHHERSFSGERSFMMRPTTNKYGRQTSVDTDVCLPHLLLILSMTILSLMLCYSSMSSTLGSTLSTAASVEPCIISISSQTPFFLNICPLYARFLSLTDASKLFVTPAVSSSHTLVLSDIIKVILLGSILIFGFSFTFMVCYK